MSFAIRSGALRRGGGRRQAGAARLDPRRQSWQNPGRYGFAV